MAEQGVKELILVAQETTVYGKDLYGKKSLHILLKELCKIQGIRWIRILYCYPEEIYEELIQANEGGRKDLPLSGSSDPACQVIRVLEAHGTAGQPKQELIEIIGKLREEIPDIFLRTTLITGFPGRDTGGP